MQAAPPLGHLFVESGAVSLLFATHGVVFFTAGSDVIVVVQSGETVTVPPITVPLSRFALINVTLPDMLLALAQVTYAFLSFTHSFNCSALIFVGSAGMDVPHAARRNNSGIIFIMLTPML